MLCEILKKQISKVVCKQFTLIFFKLRRENQSKVKIHISFLLSPVDVSSESQKATQKSHDIVPLLDHLRMFYVSS